ncbi:PorV/PorQ family protein [candidate division KSB1 bacterium]|nr:PorV/PorQ family protein [candidate division KSB1 bacterium]
MTKKIRKFKIKKLFVSSFLLLNSIFTLLCIFGFVTTSYSQASNGIGKYGASFLQIANSARQVGLGEAFTGLADDINFLQYNIGALGLVEKATIGLSYHSWIKDTQQGAVGFAAATDYGKFGFSLVYFNEGEITEFDENFQETGSIIGSNDIAMTLGVGYPKNIFGLNISFGGAFKIVRQNLADQSATALGLDLGFLIKYKHISYGATIQNFTITKLKFIEKEDPLPETYRGGVGFNYKVRDNIKINLAADVAWLMDQKLKSYCGAEVVFNKIIAVRGGYKFHDFDANRWGAGTGVIIPVEALGNSYVKVDYAYSPLAAFEGSTHRFSLIIEFDTMEKKPTAADILSEEERKKFDALAEQLRLEVEAAEKARLAAQEAEKRTKELEAEMARRLARIKAIADSSQGKIVVHPTSTMDSIRFTMRINFDFDRANIRADEFETMQRVGEILNTYPENKVQLAGHTCFIGTEEYNIRLSHRRVDSVIDFLTAKESVKLDRFFYPVGYGKQKPVASNDTPEGRSMNRRVDFTIFTKTDTPPVPEGSAIKSIEIAENNTVKIICNGKVANYKDRFLSNPDRIVIDFPNIFLLPEQKTFKFSNDLFLRARLGYHKEEKYTRVVLDLKAPLQYQVAAKDNIIYVSVK